MCQKRNYLLRGYIIGTNEFDQYIWKSLDISTDKEGLKQIIENPLQEYVEKIHSVNYVYFEVYKFEVKRTDEIITLTCTIKPIKIIEAGKNPLPEDEQKYVKDHWIFEKVLKIDYPLYFTS
jgi:uncharacterized protein Usg